MESYYHKGCIPGPATSLKVTDTFCEFYRPLTNFILCFHFLVIIVKQINYQLKLYFGNSFERSVMTSGILDQKLIF